MCSYTSSVVYTYQSTIRHFYSWFNIFSIQVKLLLSIWSSPGPIIHHFSDLLINHKWWCIVSFWKCRWRNSRHLKISSADAGASSHLLVRHFNFTQNDLTNRSLEHYTGLVFTCSAIRLFHTLTIKNHIINML